MTRILVVEDERDIREVLAYNLGQAGHEVLAPDSGAGALASVRETRRAADENRAGGYVNPLSIYCSMNEMSAPDMASRKTAYSPMMMSG
jgi:CheY-like chemotaxis protein